MTSSDSSAIALRKIKGAQVNTPRQIEIVPSRSRITLLINFSFVTMF